MPVMTGIRPESTAVAVAMRGATILVATDGYEQSDAALRAALALATPDGECHVVAVVPPLPIVTPEVQLPISGEFLASRRADLHRDIDAQLARIGPLSPARVVVEIEDGDPVSTIVQVARRTHAKLIVAGIGRHKMVDRLFGTETTLSLMRASPVPVLAVSRTFVLAPKQIVVAIDFSEPSTRAAHHALSICDPAATVDLVHVGPRANRSTAWEAWGTEYERGAMVAMTAMRRTLGIPDGVTINEVLLRGDPAAELLQHAARVGADLIVIGSHGHGYITRLLIGSVATEIVRASRFAVLAAPYLVAPSDYADARDSLTQVAPFR